MNYKKFKRIGQSIIAQERRREEIAFLYLLEGYTVEEIVEYSVYSLRTIKRDIEYIKDNPEKFF